MPKNWYHDLVSDQWVGSDRDMQPDELHTIFNGAVPASLRPDMNPPGDVEKKIAIASYQGNKAAIDSMMPPGLVEGAGNYIGQLPQGLTGMGGPAGIFPTSQILGGALKAAGQAIQPQNIVNAGLTVAGATPEGAAARFALGAGGAALKSGMQGEMPTVGNMLGQGAASAVLPGAGVTSGGPVMTPALDGIRTLFSSTMDSLSRGEHPSILSSIMATTLGMIGGRMKWNSKIMNANMAEFNPATVDPDNITQALASAGKLNEARKIIQKQMKKGPGYLNTPAGSLKQQNLAMSLQRDESQSLFASVPKDNIIPWTDIQRRAASFGIPDNVFAKIEKDTGLPLNSEVWRPLMEQKMQAQMERNQAVKEYADLRLPFSVEGGAFKGARQTLSSAIGTPAPTGGAAKLQRWVEASTLERPDLEKTLNFTSAELGKANDLDQFWEKQLGKAGIDKEQFMSMIDSVRKNGWDNTFPAQAPRNLQFMKNMFDDGWLKPDTYHPAAVFQQVNKHLVAQRTTEPVVNAIKEKYLIPAAPGAAPKLIDTDKNMADYLNQYLKGFHPDGGDIVERSVGYLSYGINNILEATGSKVRIKDSMARDLARSALSNPYVSALGMRPGPVIRNGLQPIITGYPVLGDYYWKGVALSKTPYGEYVWDKMKKMGLEGGADLASRELQEESSAATTLGRAMKKYGDTMLHPYSMQDDINNKHIALGQFQKTMDAAAFHDPANDLAYSKKAGFGSFYNDSERNRILQLAHSGAYERAALEHGIMATQGTQWSRLAEKSEALTKLGVAGQFGSWPQHYAAYLYRIFNNGDPRLKVGGVNPEKLATVARFFGAATAGYEAIRLAGESLGADPNDVHSKAIQQIGLAPASWLGGPAVSDSSWGDKAIMFTGYPIQLQRDATTFARLLREHKPGDALATAAGLETRPKGPEKPTQQMVTRPNSIMQDIRHLLLLPDRVPKQKKMTPFRLE